MYKTLKTFMIIAVLGLLIYLGYYNSVEGLQNVAKTLLWIFTIILFIASFSSDKKKNKKAQKKMWKATLYFGRLCWAGLIFALLYGGAIFMGVMWIISIIIIKAVEASVEIERVEDGKK